MSTDDQKLQNKLRRFERQRQQMRTADLGEVLSSKTGRRFFNRLVFDICGLDAQSINLNIKDGICCSMHTAYREGQRLVGHELMIEAQKTYPHHVQTMQREATANADADQQEQRSIESSAGDSQ